LQEKSLELRKKTGWIIAGLVIALVFAIFLSTAFGAASVPLPDIVKMSLNKLAIFHFNSGWQPSDETIIFDIRLPRVLGGALVGAALAVAGVLFQGLLRNPMADPYIIGTSAGAAMGAVLAMLLPVSTVFLGFGLVPALAFSGALATVMVVYSLARIGGKAPIVSMLLAGMVISSILAAVMSFLMSISDRLGLNLHSVFSFLMGGNIEVTNWSQIAVVAVLVIGGTRGARFFAYHLNAFALGEENAAYLGVEVERDKMIILGLGSLLTAAAVSISGLIGFVGLIVPHAIRLSLSTDHKVLIPVSALAGAVFLVLADLLARVVLAPSEIPVGIITAIIGGPFFLILLRRTKREYSF
jgi:iron complex transport system permease protein